MSDEWAKERDEAAQKEHIYQPKYGGKDHSGYDTMMKYEINYEREEAFCNGADFGRDYELKRSAELVEKLKAIIWAYENNVG